MCHSSIPDVLARYRGREAEGCLGVWARARQGFRAHSCTLAAAGKGISSVPFKPRHLQEEELRRQINAGTPRGEGEGVLQQSWSDSQCKGGISLRTTQACWCPCSAGAKIVAKLAFNKIRSLHAAVAEQSRAAEAKAGEVARLQATIEGLEAAAAERGEAVAAAESKLAQVGLAAGHGRQ